jgi:transcriptional regulator with XRE-family HTH domain
MPEYRDTLREELRDEDYRYAYAEDFLNTLVATQIKLLREQRGLTQQELAELIGTKQTGISRLENVNYSAWKTETLRKLARALGVRLRITFETFGTLLNEAESFSQQGLQRPEFDSDPAFAEPEAEVFDAEVAEEAPVHFQTPASRDNVHG